MKKRRTGLHIVLGICAVLIVLGCIYTRPMALDYLCKGLDLAAVDRVQVRATIYEEGEKAADAPAHNERSFDLDADDPAIRKLTALLEGASYRRKLSSFLPTGTRTHLNRAGDSRWELILTGSSLLQVTNFFGKLDIRYSNQEIDKHWRCSVYEQDAFLQAVLDAIYSIEAN